LSSEFKKFYTKGDCLFSDRLIIEARKYLIGDIKCKKIVKSNTCFGRAGIRGNKATCYKDYKIISSKTFTIDKSLLKETTCERLNSFSKDKISFNLIKEPFAMLVAPNLAVEFEDFKQLQKPHKKAKSKKIRKGKFSHHPADVRLFSGFPAICFIDFIIKSREFAL